MKTNETIEIKTEKKIQETIIEFMKYFMAFIVLAFYFGIITFLFFKVEGSAGKETEWGKYLFLVAGIEAIVFVAVGYVFGKDIARKSQANAQKIVNASEKVTKQAVQDKENAQKKTQKKKEQLIALIETIITEHSLLNRTSNDFSVQTTDETPKSRAFNLALELKQLNNEQEINSPHQTKT